MIFQSTFSKGVGLLIAFILLGVSMGLSIVLGYTDTSIADAVTAFTSDNTQNNTYIVIKDHRLPRALIASSVGASLGIAGLFMQALTRNPLASPGIFGVNAGASFFVVIVVSSFQTISISSLSWVSFLGAGFAAGLVYFVGVLGREGLTPVRLTLAGAAIAGLFSSMTQGVLVLNEKALDEVLFWLAGSVQGRSMENLFDIFPYLLVAWILSLFLSRHINVLTMGEDVATGLGQRTGWIKALAGLIIVLLAGGSVAIAGPIGFVGIVVPHFARNLVGYDQRWLVPYTAALGAILLLVADISARFVIMPEEVPVGIMTAVIGTPLFIHIARKGLKTA
ncbi:FecCD family ABC transporter permease [Pontibacillus salicampi]|uniref:FecCD family ABC transporter permease n=1 Tax=Pontibacillus salicampi TaxID=1449801 RepID=A0ABV6LNP6_9BACI